jgi:hypothetical protein
VIYVWLSPRGGLFSGGRWSPGVPKNQTLSIVMTRGAISVCRTARPGLVGARREDERACEMTVTDPESSTHRKATRPRCILLSSWPASHNIRRNSYGSVGLCHHGRIGGQHTTSQVPFTTILMGRVLMHCLRTGPSARRLSSLEVAGVREIPKPQGWRKYIRHVLCRHGHAVKSTVLSVH